MKRLVLFGDSLFAQAGKERLLMLEEALPEFDAYNCAAGGWNTNDGVKKAPYISQLQADVVVISLGTNDAAPWKQVPLETFIDNLPQIFNAFKGSRLIYLLPPPANEAKSGQGGMPLTNEDLREYYENAKKLCEDNQVTPIDSRGLFQPLLDAGKDYHQEDGVHLADEAYQLIWRELAKLLAT